MNNLIYNARYHIYTPLGTLIEWIRLCLSSEAPPSWEQAPSWVCPVNPKNFFAFL